MSDSTEIAEPNRRKKIGKAIIVSIKLALTAACFWYLAHQLDLTSLARTIPQIHFSWVGLAILVAALQIPLIGLRWFKILDALPGPRARRSDAIAINAISTFFGQLLPSGGGDAIRVALLSRLGRAWKPGIISVIIDRGVAVEALFLCGFLLLLLPSTLVTLGDYRGIVLSVFGIVPALSLVALACTPRIASILGRWRLTEWAGIVASTVFEVLAKSRTGFTVLLLAFAAHSLTILCVWCVGQAVDIPLSFKDAAVLFVSMICVTLLPVSIGGWGLREVAVVALLGTYGVAPEAALSLSVTFGVIVILSSLPGAIVWAAYSPPQPSRQ